MSKQAIVSRQGEGEQLQVLGVGLRFLCRKENTAGAWSLMENLIPENAGPPPHFHPWDEAYYVVSGQIEFTLDGTPLLVGAGDFVYAPGNTVHAFRGASKEPARMLIFDAPAHAEGFFKDVHSQVRTMPDDLPKLPVIGQQHGLTFLPDNR